MKIKQPRILAIIPARGGSKGLPRKNMHSLNGSPLIKYTIDAANNCETITKTVVTSEDEEILNYSKRYCEIIKRPETLSMDNVPCESAILHCLEYFTNDLKEQYDLIVVLQPTSPLRDDLSIDGALCEYLSTDAISSISVYEPEKNPVKSFLVNSKNGYLKGIAGNDFPFMNRQDIPIAYMPNGAIYITTTDEFLRTGKLFSEKTIPYVMTSKKSVDIDVIKDIWIAEELMSI